MLSFQRKSLSFESALSYLQAFNRNSHAFLWKRSSLFQHFNSLCDVNGVLLHFLNAVFLDKITLFWNCLKLLTSIHKKLTSVSLKEKQSVPILQFTVRSEWSAASLSKCSHFRENHSLWNCLKPLKSIHKKLTSVSLKEKQSVPTLQFTVRSEWSVPSHSKCCPSEKISLLWKCLKLLSSIHKKLTSVSLKEKQSVPTLQFTVRSEWSVASLSKWCPFRENHFPLKVP